jgi:hypothetical protein
VKHKCSYSLHLTAPGQVLFALCIISQAPCRNAYLQRLWMCCRPPGKRSTIVVYGFNSAFWFSRVPAKTYSMHGGAGALISVALLRRVPYEHIHRCIQEAYSSGGDGMITECLWEVHPFLPALSFDTMFA